MAGGMITTGNNPALLWPGIKALFGQYNQDWPAHYPALFDKVSSDKQYETYVQMTGFPLAQPKTQAGSFTYVANSQGFTYRLSNIAIGLGYFVSHEEIQDNLYKGTATDRAAMLNRSMMLYKEFAAVNLYNNAFSSNTTYADGTSLINSAHPTVGGGLQSNQLAVASDLSDGAIEDMMIQLAGTQDDLGLPFHLQGESLIIHSHNMFNADRILKSTNRSGTANNDINAGLMMKILPKGILMNPYLTNPGAWFVRTNVPEGKGLILQEREGMSFEMANDIDTKGVKHTAYERYAFGVVDWRAIAGSNGP